MFKGKNQYYLYLIFLAVISLTITFVSLGFEKNFIGEDSGVAFDFPSALKDQTYFMWDSHRAPGKTNISSVFNFIWNNFIILLSHLGLSGFIIKRILFFLFFFLTGVGMFNLARFLLLRHYKNNTSHVLFSSFVAGLIYMLNPYSAQLTSFPIINYHISYIFFPWVLLMFIANINSPLKFKNILIFSVTVVITVSANPSNTAVIILFILFYCIFFIRSSIANWRQNVTFLTSSVFLILLLSSFIILPTLATETNIYGIETIDFDSFLGSIRLHSTFTNFFNLFRLIGARDWPTFPYSPAYDRNLLFLLLSFLVPVTAFISLFFKTARKEKIFFLFTAIFFVFAAKGIREPLSDLFLFFFKTYPILGMFRAVYFKFMFPVVLSLAMLIAFTFMEIQKKENFIKNNKLFMISVILLLFINNFPFFIGLIPKNIYLNNIPHDYLKLEGFFKNKPQGKILSLPESPNGAGPLLKWGKDKYIGPPTDFFFTDRPTFDGHWLISQEILNFEQIPWESTTLANNADKIVELSGILNIRYFLVHKDLLHEYKFTTSSGPVLLNGPLKTNILTKNFQTNPLLRMISSTEYYDIYERLFLPNWGRIYIPEKLILADEEALGLYTYKNPTDYTFAVVKADAADKLERLKLNNQTNVTYKEIDPTSYEITLKKAAYPLLLVFSETYHPQWKLKNKHGDILPEVNHLLVNSYANAWIINDGSEFKLEFTPQQYFTRGLLVSALTFIGCLIMLIYELTFKRKK